MRRVTSSVTLLLGSLMALSAMPALAAEPSGSPDSSGPTVVPLEGTMWRLTNARLSGAYAPIPASVFATLVLQDGHAGGSGGCNQWFADYTLDGTSLTFGTIGSTLMFCEGDGGSIETFYLADLPAVAAWAIDGTTLTLSADDGQPVLAYTVLPTPSPMGTWDVTGYTDATGNLVSVEGPAVTLVFDATTVSGDADCNGFSGGWKQDGDTLAIGPLMSTKMACEPAELMARETAIMADLEASTAIRAAYDGGVDLLDSTGVVRLTLAVDQPLVAPSVSPAS